MPEPSSLACAARRCLMGKERDAIRSNGYVARWRPPCGACRTESFEDALVLAVNLGEDADTVGAVTKQLAGACCGLDAVPERWLTSLAWWEQILRMADALPDRPGLEPVTP